MPICIAIRLFPEISRFNFSLKRISSEFSVCENEKQMFVWFIYRTAWSPCSPSSRQPPALPGRRRPRRAPPNAELSRAILQQPFQKFSGFPIEGRLQRHELRQGYEASEGDRDAHFLAGSLRQAHGCPQLLIIVPDHSCYASLASQTISEMDVWREF